VSLSYPRIPVIACNWPGCTESFSSVAGKRASDIRRHLERKGWGSGKHGTDYCPTHNAPHSMLIPSFSNSTWCNFVTAEQCGLTYKQANMLAGAARGLSNAEIAEHIGLSVEGVRSSWRRIFEIMGVHERAAAVAVAYDLQIFRPLEDRVSKAAQLKALQVAS